MGGGFRIDARGVAEGQVGLEAVKNGDSRDLRANQTWLFSSRRDTYEEKPFREQARLGGKVGRHGRSMVSLKVLQGGGVK